MQLQSIVNDKTTMEVTATNAYANECATFSAIVDDDECDTPLSLFTLVRNGEIMSDALTIDWPKRSVVVSFGDN